jgi:hypothetical protein
MSQNSCRRPKDRHPGAYGARHEDDKVHALEAGADVM